MNLFIVPSVSLIIYMILKNMSTKYKIWNTNEISIVKISWFQIC